MPRSTVLPGRAVFKRLSWRGGVPEPAVWPFAGGDGDAVGGAVVLPGAGDYRHACGAADSTVHRINARAEVRVTKELIKEFKRVTGKENLLFRVAEATVNAGDQLVGDAVFPVASQAVLADLVAGFKSSGPTYQRTVKAAVKGSSTNHYRTGLIKLLDVLEFRSNDTIHRPVLDALRLITRHAGAGNRHYYPAGEDIPVPPRPGGAAIP